MDQHGKEPVNLVERNPDGSFTKETLTRAIKALKKRMELTRLDDESRLGHDAISKGGHSGIVAVKPPTQYPAEVWQALAQKGRVRIDRNGLVELIEQPSNPYPAEPFARRTDFRVPAMAHPSCNTVSPAVGEHPAVGASLLVDCP